LDAVDQQLVVVEGEGEIPAAQRFGYLGERGLALLQRLAHLGVLRLVEVYLHEGPGEGLQEVKRQQFLVGSVAHRRKRFFPLRPFVAFLVSNTMRARLAMSA